MTKTHSKSKRYDLVVVGGGSAGIGAALAAARLGSSVLLVELSDTLGGTAVLGGVSCWEMSAGGTGIPFDIYRRLKKKPQAVGIYSCGRHFLWAKPDETPFPGGESIIDPPRRYRDTLQRCGARSMKEDEEFVRRTWHGVPFEPEAYCKTVLEMLQETGRCEIAFQTTVTGATWDSGRVESITLSDYRRVQAGTYIEATGDAILPSLVGCSVMTGREPRAAYDEPSAPENASPERNGVSLIYRITPTDTPGVEPLPDDIPSNCWWDERFPFASYFHYPNGDLNVNMLPTMRGLEYAATHYTDSLLECRRRVLAHWNHSQTIFPEFQKYRLSWIAPALGVRESCRIVGRYVLTENDLRAGLSGQTHDDIIAITDHAMDTHGRNGGCVELPEPYGVPYRCLVAEKFVNLLIAGRTASFSSIAASSCRLSRTMIQLGQAAGTAAHLAKVRGVPAANVSPKDLRRSLREQHVQLDWPLSEELQNYLDDE